MFLSVTARPELFYFVLAAYDLCFGSSVLNRCFSTGLSTQLCTNYCSSLTLHRLPYMAWSQKLSCFELEVWLPNIIFSFPTQIVWWYTPKLSLISFMPLQFCQEILMGYWICHTVSSWGRCRYPETSVVISYFHIF